MRHRSWLLLAVGAVLVLMVGGLLLINRHRSNTQIFPAPVNTKAKHYSLKLLSGTTYQIGKPTSIRFQIADQFGAVLKDTKRFGSRQVHLIIVRKDRTEYQHRNPTLDQASGIFTSSDVIFPSDGEYRLYADITSFDHTRDLADGLGVITTFADVKVGEVASYNPVALDSDSLTASAGPLTENIYFIAGDDSPGSVPNTDYYPELPGTVTIKVDKDGKPFTELEPYQTTLGNLVAFGPNLELVNLYYQTPDIDKQLGLIMFDVTFPTSGRYKLFLQTQAEGQAYTTGYVLSVKESPSVKRGGSQ
jgi:hypothetical protein